LFDFGPVAFTSMNPEDTESNLDLILNSYYNRFRETCLNLGVKEEDLLWTWDDINKTSLILQRNFYFYSLFSGYSNNTSDSGGGHSG